MATTRFISQKRGRPKGSSSRMAKTPPAEPSPEPAGSGAAPEFPTLEEAIAATSNQGGAKEDTTEIIRREVGQSDTSMFGRPFRPGSSGDTTSFSRADHAQGASGDTTQFIRREIERNDGDSAIKLYLREIGQTKLLTVEQEIELAARIKKGDKEAREHMIKANLRLVVKIARDYEGLGLPLLDLISEGNIGLMKAVERFDPAKGGKLSTYGSWWIKQSIKRALANQSKTIRLPVHLVDKISKMRRAAMRMQEELGREPTDEELAAELGTTAGRVSQMRTASIRPASLDAPVGDDDSNNYSEIVEDERAINPYDELEDKTVTGMLQEMVKHLDEREATILRYRFGLNGGSERTLEEVGEKFGVTRERVRQIQNLALRKLRKMIEKFEDTRET